MNEQISRMLEYDIEDFFMALLDNENHMLSTQMTYLAGTLHGLRMACDNMDEFDLYGDIDLEINEMFIKFFE